MLKHTLNTPFDYKERNSRQTPKTAGIIRFGRFAIVPLLLSLIAPVKAESIPPKFISGDSLKNGRNSQVANDSPFVEESVLSELEKSEKAQETKSINWGDVEKSMNLINFILSELTPKPGKPSLFKIGDELIANKPLDADSRNQLAGLVDKYKVTGAEKVRILLKKDKLTPGDYAFLKSQVLEIVRVQKQIALISKRTRELLQNISSNAIKHAGEIQISQDDLNLFHDWYGLMERTARSCQKIIDQLDGLERDLISGK